MKGWIGLFFNFHCFLIHKLPLIRAQLQSISKRWERFVWFKFDWFLFRIFWNNWITNLKWALLFGLIVCFYLLTLSHFLLDLPKKHAQVVKDIMEAKPNLAIVQRTRTDEFIKGRETHNFLPPNQSDLANYKLLQNISPYRFRVITNTTRPDMDGTLNKEAAKEVLSHLHNFGCHRVPVCVYTGKLKILSEYEEFKKIVRTGRGIFFFLTFVSMRTC